MAPEIPRGRKFPELVANHIFSDENGDELVAVMYSDGVTNKFRNDR